MLGQFSGKKEPDGSLNFSRSDRTSLVVMGQSGSFCGNAFEDVVDEAVHYGHGFGGDTGVGMDLLENLVDVDAVRFLPPPLLLLVSLGNGLLGLSGFLSRLA